MEEQERGALPPLAALPARPEQETRTIVRLDYLILGRPSKAEAPPEEVPQERLTMSADGPCGWSEGAVEAQGTRTIFPKWREDSMTAWASLAAARGRTA